MKAGDKIQIKEEHRELVRTLKDQVDGAKAGLNAMSETLNQRHDVLWKTIKELYPSTAKYIVNLDTAEYVLTILHHEDVKCTGCGTKVPFGLSYQEDDGEWCSVCWITKETEEIHKKLKVGVIKEEDSDES